MLGVELFTVKEMLPLNRPSSVFSGCFEAVLSLRTVKAAIFP
jgi:hypothetical protein